MIIFEECFKDHLLLETKVASFIFSEIETLIENISSKLKILLSTPSPLNINKSLYTKNIPDPDLLIRTGNTNRLSNFLLWQLSYSEIYFEKKLWPEFTEKDYNKIIKKFRSIKRNFGKI